MDPNQPNQAPQQPYVSDYSVDYLNQIAQPQQTAGGPSKIVMLIAAAVGLLSVVLFLVMILTSGPSAGDRASEVYARLATLSEIAQSQQDELRDNELRAINSGLSLQLTNALADMTDPLASVGVSPDGIDPSLEEEEEAYKQQLLDDFEDANLNVQLDATYTREMAFQLETLRALMDSTYRESRSEALKTYLDETARELYPFSEKLSQFQPA